MIKTHPKNSWHDADIQNLIGNILRTGVILSAAIVLIGGILYLLKYGSTVLDHRMFRGEPSDLRHIKEIISNAVSLHSRGIIQLGLLILIATPILRVGLSSVAFFKERDFMYMVVSLIVLSFLLFGLMGGVISVVK